MASNPTEFTAGELGLLHVKLEEAAASGFGRLLLEFSRLDMLVGLCAVWLQQGQRLAELNERVPDLSFHARLRLIEGAIENLPTGSRGPKAYRAWLARADAARLLRNDLVHGRWGFEPPDQLVNVIGLPTSPLQRSKRFTIAQLDAAVEELRALQVELSRLRGHWPL